MITGNIEKTEKPKSFRRVVRQIYKSSEKFKLDQLMAEQTRWSRKLKIAQKKLEKVRREIDKYTAELVEKVDGQRGT